MGQGPLLLVEGGCDIYMRTKDLMMLMQSINTLKLLVEICRFWRALNPLSSSMSPYQMLPRVPYSLLSLIFQPATNPVKL